METVARPPSRPRSSSTPSAQRTQDHGRGRLRHRKARWTPRASQHLETAGRGRLLPPQSRTLLRSATPGKKATTRPTRNTVAEGTQAAALRREPRSPLPRPPRHPRPRRRPHPRRRRHQLQRLPRPDARPRRRIGLRQDDHRPRDPPPHRTHRRPASSTTASTSPIARRGDLRSMRGKMQIIFQDPYGSLNPRMTIEAAITEPMIIQGIGTNRADRRDRAAALLEEVGLKPDPPPPLPARILRRPAAAHLHRPRARRRARVHHLRRIGLGARRLRAGPGAQPAQGAARQTRPHLHLHQPRPERREVHGRHDGRDERRQDRRVRPVGKHLHEPAKRTTPAASSTPRPRTTST